MNETLARIARLKGYLSSDPGNSVLACDLVDSQFDMGAYSDADELMASLPVEALESPGIRFRRARVALVLGRYGEAVELLRGLIADQHDNVALWHDLAFSQLCLRETAAASETLAQAQSRFGDSSELAVVEARVAMMERDFPKAQSAIDRALALAPDHATALGLRALSLLDAGDIQAASDAAEACLRLHPDQHEALLAAGTTSLWRQDVDRADASLSRALDRHPNSGRARSAYGQVLMLRNDLSGAREQLRMAVVAMPDHIGTWHALAWTQLLLGDIDGAESSYASAYDLDRNFADSHGGLALIHALRGRSEDADLSIRRALRLDPRCATALYARSVLLSDAGQHDEAHRLLASLVNPSGAPMPLDIGEFARNLRARFNTPNAPHTPAGTR